MHSACLTSVVAGRVTVHNASHLQWVQWSSTLQEVVDEFWIVQHADMGPLGAQTSQLQRLLAPAAQRTSLGQLLHEVQPPPAAC